MRGMVAGLAVFLAAGAAQADEFPPGAMLDVVAKACTQCHSSSLITSSGKTREDWASTVTTMIGNGANVSDADFDKVVDYLAQSFPAK